MGGGEASLPGLTIIVAAKGPQRAVRAGRDGVIRAHAHLPPIRVCADFGQHTQCSGSSDAELAVGVLAGGPKRSILRDCEHVLRSLAHADLHQTRACRREHKGLKLRQGTSRRRFDRHCAGGGGRSDRVTAYAGTRGTGHDFITHRRSTA